MRITITMEVADELVDEFHPYGVNEAAYIDICGSLDRFGDDIEIRRADR